jgi:hypothetical protein
MPVLNIKAGAPKAQDKCIISQKMMVEWSMQLIDNIVFYLKVTLCRT